jgi:hypothetical protein
VILRGAGEGVRRCDVSGGGERDGQVACIPGDEASSGVGILLGPSLKQADSRCLLR